MYPLPLEKTMFFVAAAGMKTGTSRWRCAIVDSGAGEPARDLDPKAALTLVGIQPLSI